MGLLDAVSSEDGSLQTAEGEANSTMWRVLWMVVASVVLIVFTPSLRETFAFGKKLQKAKEGDRYSSIDSYNNLQDDSKTDTQGREKGYAELVNSYYDLATEFYEWGWGTSFHFADRRKGESFQSSILRHETYLAGRLGVKKGAKLLDCGCGVGGPARNISSFTGAHVTGITIKKAIEEGDGLPDMCHTSVCTKALESCGFEVMEARDAAEDGHPGGDPWYRPLTPSWKPWVLPGFQFNPVVFRIFPVFLRILEAIRVVPVGTSKTQVMLQAGGIGCERGGATGVFTPMWLMVGRKPASN